MPIFQDDVAGGFLTPSSLTCPMQGYQIPWGCNQCPPSASPQNTHKPAKKQHLWENTLEELNAPSRLTGTGPHGHQIGDLHPFIGPAACTVLHPPSPEISRGYFSFCTAVFTARGSAHPAQVQLDGAGSTQVSPEKLLLFHDITGMM